ncbi:MAG: Ig-like domain-containing protein [bacterium]
MKNRQAGQLKKLAFGVLIFCLLFVFHACKINSDRPDDDSTDLGAALTSISVTPANPTLADPSTQQFTATGTYANGSTSDITTSVNWVSEYPAIATISNESNNTANPKGLAKTAITGSTKITARSGDVIGSTTLTVTSAQLKSIEVTPGYASYAYAITPWVQFKATGIYNDGTAIDLTEFATWSSSNTSAATINNVSGSKGLATTTATATSTTTITAAYQSVSGSTNLTLNNASLDNSGVVDHRLIYTPFNPTLAKKTHQQFKATARLDNGKGQDVTPFVVWNSATTANATISNADDTRGLALMGSNSSVTSVISANLDTLTGSINSTVTISAAYLYELQINPGFPYIAPDIQFPLKAIGIFRDGSVYYWQDLTEWVSWSSSDTSLAAISNANGSKGLLSLTQVPGVANRTATITVKSPLLTTLTGTTTLTVRSSSLALSSITISPSAPTNYLDTNQTFKAYGSFTDGTTSYKQDISQTVVWSSSNTSVAVVSNEGVSHGKTVNRSSGQTTIKATLGDVSGDAAFTVMPDTYTVTALTITPTTLAAFTGTDLHLTATATFSNGSSSFTQDVTESVFWTSDATGTAMVSNVEGSRGVVTGIAAGGTNINAIWKTYRSSVSSYSTITANSPITVVAIASITSLTVSAASTAGTDGSYQLTATATDGTNSQDVTESAIWSSSRPEVASVINIPGRKGKLFNNASGSTTITVRIDNESATLSRTVQ